MPFRQETARSRVNGQDFSVLDLSPREQRDAAALQLALDRLHHAGTRRDAIRTPAAVVVYTRRRVDAGDSLSSVCRSLNELGLRAPKGGDYYPAVLAHAMRSGIIDLIDAPALAASRDAVAALERVLEVDADPDAPVLKVVQRRALLAAIAALRSL